MANRETYPASQSPLQGDLSGQAGQTNVTVVGLQSNPMAATPPTDQQRLVFHSASGDWEPTTPGNESIEIEGVPVSDDYDIGIELSLGTTLSPVKIEGV